MRLGYDPGQLRFFYGSLGARISQFMCVIFVIGLLVLASVSKDFLYGMFVLGLLGGLTYAAMFQYLGEDEIAEFSLLNNDDTIDDHYVNSQKQVTELITKNSYTSNRLYTSYNSVDEDDETELTPRDPRKL